MDKRLIADVRVRARGGGVRGGTGYLVGPSLVLTAAHVLEGHENVDVRLGVDPPGEFVRCTVRWTSEHLDVALLRLEKARHCPPVHWGRFFGDDPQRYDALGYPDLAANDHRRDVKHLQGSLRPLDGIVSGDLVLSVQREYTKDVPWNGFSGTAVFTKGLLVGVIAVHKLDTGDLRAHRTHRLAKDPEFVRLLEEDTGRRPWFVPTRFAFLKRFAWLRKARRRATHRHWIVRSTVLCTVLAAFLALVWPGPLLDELRGSDAACAPPGELVVLTTPDQFEAVQRSAVDFSAHRGREEDGCVPVRVSVTTAGGTERTRELLGSGWEDLREGPRPHVWLPDSTADIALLPEDAENTPGLTVTGSTRITPLVLGLPASAADIPACAGTDPEGARSNLAECATAAAEAGILLARPSPEASTSALLQTDALYSAYGGPENAEAIQLAESRVTSAGLDAEGNLGLLCALRSGEVSPSAVGVFGTEYAIHAYNAGGALGPGCGQRSEKPEEPLVPVYFADAPDLDHPFVRLHWGGDDGTGRAVGEFERWMTQNRDMGSDAFEGYRAVDGLALGEDDVLAHPEAVPAPAEFESGEWRERLEETLHKQERSRTPIEVLLAVDRSDSMTGPGTGGTRLETAQELARSAIGLLGEQDTVGIWAFPKDGSGDDVTEQEHLLPPEPAMDPEREASAGAAIAALRAEFPATPLADTIRDGAEELAGCVDRPGHPGACALIVLTDGVALPEPRGGAEAEDVADALGALDEHVQVHVVSVGNEGCGGDGLLSRMASAGVRCHHPRGDELDQVVYGIVAGLRAVSR